MNREALLAELNASRENFLELIDDLQDEKLLSAGVSNDWSIKDILAHLTRWEGELVKLLWQVSQGQRPSSLHFSRQSVDEINEEWQKKSRSRPLALVLEDFHGVRTQTVRRLEHFSDRDLNDTERFPWLEGQALWQWIADDTYLHEQEHAEQIRSWPACNKTE